jgi:RimJ/RimL family protein N-acetyltransferase
MKLPARRKLPDGRQLVVRVARPYDAEAHIRNFNQIAAERVFVMTENFTRTVEEIRTQFGDADPNSALWLVAEVDGAVVGGANFLRGRWKKNSHTADLGIAILSEFRGLGIGEVLMQAGIEWARRVGVRKLKLEVFASNVRAIRLYGKLGFAEEGRLKGEVMLDGHPVDEVLMALWL